jgi:class 3 adenylate cyclase
VSVDLDGLLDILDDRVRTEFAAMPEVQDVDDLDVDRLPRPGARKWMKQEDVVAVVCDLKGSTALGLGKHDRSTASIYEAATGGAVTILNQFGADFIAIQGDGAFGLYWGDRAIERAVCAGITIKTFSADQLIKRLEAKWPDGPNTGFKVGIAHGRVLAKLIGTQRKTDQQEPVWAGTPVNYAAKAAQAADRHQLIITDAVWQKIQLIDFLRYTCGCTNGTPGTPTNGLWTKVTIDNIPADRSDRHGQLLNATWCVNHGAEYVDAILLGEKANPATTALRAKETKEQAQAAHEALQAQRQSDRTARRRGMR